MYTHILLAADGSDHSFRAAQHAAALAGGQITVLFVPTADQAKGSLLQKERLAAIQRERKVKLSRHEAVFQERDIPFKVIVKEGDPGPAIVKYANEHHVDLVILGSRGLNNLQEFVLGSVSHKVMKRAHCPVMIVK